MKLNKLMSNKNKKKHLTLNNLKMTHKRITVLSSTILMKRKKKMKAWMSMKKGWRVN